MSRVIVVGASGRVGKETLKALITNHGKAELQACAAGTRNVDDFEAMEGVTVVHADMGDKTRLVKTLKYYDRVFLVTPGAENRVELVLNGLEACKEANIDYVLVLSTLTGTAGSLFDKHFVAIESAAKESGLAHTIVRLNYFDENFQYFTSNGVMNDPRDPTARISFGNLKDTAEACAALLANPKQEHYSRTYSLVSKPTTIQEICDQQGVKYNRVSYEETRKTYLNLFGMGEWQVKGLMELFQAMDTGAFDITNNHVAMILGRI